MNRPRMFLTSNIIIKYQIIDEEGNPILEPFFEMESAQFMINEYYPGYTILEVECE